MKDATPRIHTLRSDGKTPRTSDCGTPHSIEGIDGAFKGPTYGSFMEGPFRSPHVWTGRMMWLTAFLLVIVTAVLVLL